MKVHMLVRFEMNYAGLIPWCKDNLLEICPLNNIVQGMIFMILSFLDDEWVVMVSVSKFYMEMFENWLIIILSHILNIII